MRFGFRCLMVILWYYSLLLLVLLDGKCWSLSSSSPSTMNNNNNNNNNIHVEVKRILNVSPKEALQAWHSYHFEKGGDLPLVFIRTKEQRRRLLLPALLEETLLPPTSCKDDSLVSVAYTVSDFGPFLGLDFIPGSHLGNVTFTPINENDGTTIVSTKTEMIWKVSCQTKQRVAIWNFVTTSLITTVCNNLMEYTSIPYLYTKVTTLPNNNDYQTVISEWKSFVWKQGGKLPFCYPPISSSFYDEGNTRMYFPPGLIERITDIKTNDEKEIQYRVINPGYISFYPVHSHKGRVRFIPEGNVLKMIWQVEIRPKQPYAFVKGFTSTIVSTLSHNFQQYLLQKKKEEESSSSSSFLWNDQGGEWIQSEMPP